MLPSGFCQQSQATNDQSLRVAGALQHLQFQSFSFRPCKGLGLRATSVLGGDLDATRGCCQMLWLPLNQVFQLIPAEGNGSSASSGRRTIQGRAATWAASVLGGDLGAKRGWSDARATSHPGVQACPGRWQLRFSYHVQTNKMRTSFSALELYGKHSRLARVLKIWCHLSILPSACPPPCLDFHDTSKLDFPR